jgi:hypothetical protein
MTLSQYITVIIYIMRNSRMGLSNALRKKFFLIFLKDGNGVDWAQYVQESNMG